jgi:hypothetical protein
MSKKNRANKQQRIVCAMSFMDVIVSTVWFFTNLFIPSDIEEFPWSTGNKASCSAQGFIVQFSISSIIYNAALSYYYLLKIKYRYRDRQLEKVEIWMHIVPLTFALTTAVIALFLNMYNFAVWDCWIAPEQGASDSAASLPLILQWCFFFGPLWISIAFATINTLLIYQKVKSIEREYLSSAQEGLESRTNSMVANTKMAATQGRLYVAAFFVTWMFPTISRVIQLAGYKIPEWMIVCSGTFIPSQGIFNAVVYFRLRYIRCGEEHSTKSKLWVVRRIIKMTLFPCLQMEIERYNRVDGRDVEPSFHPSAEEHSNQSASSPTGSLPNSRLSAVSNSGMSAYSGMSFPSKSSDPSFQVSESSMTEDNETDEVAKPAIEPRRYYQRTRNMYRPGITSTDADNNKISTEPPTNDFLSPDVSRNDNTSTNLRDTPAFLLRSLISDLATIEEGASSDASEHLNSEEEDTVSSTEQAEP